MPTVPFAIGASGDDGWVWRTGASYPPTGAISTSTISDHISADRGTTGGVGQGLMRFDTSAIADNATIVSAYLDAYVSGPAGAFGPDNYNFVGEYYTWTSADNTDWALDPSGTQAFAVAKNSLSQTVGANITIPFTDLSGISKTGYTELKTHLSGGAGPSTPTGNNGYYLATLDHATLRESLLVITYTDTGGDYIQIGP